MARTRVFRVIGRSVLGLLVFSLALVVLRSHANPPASQPAAMAATDVTGQVQHPLDLAGGRAVVWIFVIHDCPICNSYAPEFKRLCEEFGPKGVRFFLINPEKDFAPAEAAKHAAEYGYPCPLLMDPRHILTKQAGATITPEAVVFGADGNVLYRGRIDDRYVDYGKSRPAATVTDLRNALTATLEGKPVVAAGGKTVGCFIADDEGAGK